MNASHAMRPPFLKLAQAIGFYVRSAEFNSRNTYAPTCVGQIRMAVLDRCANSWAILHTSFSALAPEENSVGVTPTNLRKARRKLLTSRYPRDAAIS